MNSHGMPSYLLLYKMKLSNKEDMSYVIWSSLYNFNIKYLILSYISMNPKYEAIVCVNQCLKDTSLWILIVNFHIIPWFYLCRMGIGSKKTKSSFFLVVNYVNKHVESINFRKIFKDSDVSVASPFNSVNLSLLSKKNHWIRYNIK